MKWWNEAGRLVYRSRFEPVWSHLPRVLVLAALPGWGKRTLMLQCADYFKRNQGKTSVVWAVAGADLPAKLDERRRTGAESVLLCIDARHTQRSFWQELQQALEPRAWACAVVASYDSPEDVAGMDPLVLHENDLAFDAAEIAALSTLLAEAGAVFDTPMSGDERGCATLIGNRIRGLLSHSEQGGWAQINPSREVDLLSLARSGSSGEVFRRSRIGQVLDEAREIPGFTSELIERSAGGAKQADEIFSRLAAMPFFDLDDDAEAGTAQCVWTQAAWNHLRQTESPDETRTRLERGLARVRESGRMVPQLRLLLELGRLEEAERLVSQCFRRLLLLCDTRTIATLRSNDQLEPTHHPMLTMLRNQFILRTEAFSPLRRAEDQEVLDALLRSASQSWVNEVYRGGCIAYAAAIAGERAIAGRYLSHLIELIGSAVANAEVTEEDDQRLLVVDACFLGYWSALQIDRVEDAHTLAETMNAWGRDSDRLRGMDAACLEATSDDIGLRSLAPDGTSPSCMPFNQSQSFISIEDGGDSDALQVVERFIAELGTHNSRSRPDGYGLLLLAITSPGIATVDKIESALLDSVRFWNDHRPSSFLTWACTLAFSTIGAKAEAKKWLDSIARVEDEYACLARAALAMWDGRSAEALGHVAAALEYASAPRYIICAQVLGVAAYVQLREFEHAWLRLEDAWRGTPAPRLFRFALRLIPQAVFDELRERAPGRCHAIEAVLESAASDYRALTWVERPRLTPTELDILKMLGRGFSNVEIANTRFIAIGTLRTHLKSLYKKLGVMNRHDALETAVRLEIIDLWEVDTRAQ